MRTKKLAISMTLGTLFLMSCSMAPKKTDTEVSSTGAVTQATPSISMDVVNKYTAGWPDTSTQAAKDLMIKYGEPTESSPRVITWLGIVPFKRISVYREELIHKFPILHKDVVEHVVNYRIPADKAGDLTKFNGSLTFDRTRGEMTARSNGEAMNMLILNLASEMIIGKRDYKNARTEYGKVAVDFLNGNRSVYTQGLLFVSQNNTADADESTKFNWAQAEEQRPAVGGEKKLLKQAQEEEITE
jgi:hypothetical protein